MTEGDEPAASLSASPRSLAGDFTPSPAAITLAAGGTGGTAVLPAMEDDEVVDTEILTLTATRHGHLLAVRTRRLHTWSKARPSS